MLFRSSVICSCFRFLLFVLFCANASDFCCFISVHVQPLNKNFIVFFTKEIVFPCFQFLSGVARRLFVVSPSHRKAKREPRAIPTTPSFKHDFYAFFRGATKETSYCQSMLGNELKALGLLPAGCLPWSDKVSLLVFTVKLCNCGTRLLTKRIKLKLITTIYCY